MSTVARPEAIAIPALENGDRLTRAEFERRYRAMPDVRAELVEGVVYVMASPVRASRHGEPHADLITMLGIYRIATPGVRLADNATVRLDLDNEPQPDVLLFVDPGRGGQARVSGDDYIEGAPELVAEVASSSVSLDLGDKMNAYRRNGVREYLVWRVLDGAIDWFALDEGRYGPVAPGGDGLHRSVAFPGLWLDLRALVAGDLAAAVAALNRGLASPEHAAFVDRLREAAG